MVCKEQLFRMFDSLNETDQKKVYEFMQFLADRGGDQLPTEDVIKLFGKNYFIVPD